MPDDLSYYFGLNTFDQVEYPEDEDHVAWGLQKFAGLVAKCNTQMLEMLFAEPDSVRFCHPVFRQHFIENREKFVTKEIYKVIGGYAYSEHRKALGESSRDLGARRKEDLNEYGYSCRNASHCIRLLYAGGIALDTGVFPVRLSGSIQQTCMKLKLGTLTLDEYKEAYEFYDHELNEAMVTTKLPDSADRIWLNKTLVDAHLDIIHAVKQSP
jgi:predicted nucleotidyltransferase